MEAEDAAANSVEQNSTAALCHGEYQRDATCRRLHLMKPPPQYLLGNSVALLTEVPLTHGDVGIMADKTLCRLQVCVSVCARVTYAQR